MAATETERKSRRKHSSSAKTSKPRSSSRKPRVSPSVADMYLQDYAPPVQATSPQRVTATRPTPPLYGYSASPPQHAVYRQMPGSFPEDGYLYGSPPPQPVQPYASQSTIRFASPPPHEPRGQGPFEQQWNSLDRMAAKSYRNLRDTAGKSVTNLTANCIERPTAAVATKSMQTLSKGAALYDIISSKFDSVITSIDDDHFSGKEQDLMMEFSEQQQEEGQRTSPPLGDKTTCNPTLVATKGQITFQRCGFTLIPDYHLICRRSRSICLHIPYFA